MFKNNKKIIYIDGMKCNNCAKKVEDNLIKLPNIKKVKIDLQKKMAVVLYIDEINEAIIKNKIEDLGYNVIS